MAERARDFVSQCHRHVTPTVTMKATTSISAAGSEMISDCESALMVHYHLFIYWQIEGVMKVNHNHHPCTTFFFFFLPSPVELFQNTAAHTHTHTHTQNIFVVVIPLS